MRGAPRLCEEQRRAETIPPVGIRETLIRLIAASGFVEGRRPAVVRFEGSEYG